MVKASPYLAHTFLVVIGDFFFLKLSRRLAGEQTTRMAFALYISNFFFNKHIIRCFGNSVETILNIVVFNYYLDITKSYDKNIKIVALCLSIALGIRTTSIIGWLPLLFIKIMQIRTIIPFLKAGIFVALPTITGIIVIDSIYYKQFTVTGYNFMHINVVENRSAEFGTGSNLIFITEYLPYTLGFLKYFIIFAIMYEVHNSSVRKRIPVTLIFVTFYLMVLSLVPHKESRFMIPVMPYLFIMLAQLFSYIYRQHSFCAILVVCTILSNSLLQILMHIGHTATRY